MRAAIVPDAPASEAAPNAPEAGSIDVEQADGADDRIAARLTDIFTNVPSLSAVTASVSEGVVTLGGTAPDAEAVARAESIAIGVDGVVTVENSIERDVSVNIGAGVGGLEDKLRGAWRMVPLAGLALLVGLLIAGFGYLLASFRGLWTRIAPNVFLAELIASALRFIS